MSFVVITTTTGYRMNYTVCFYKKDEPAFETYWVNPEPAIKFADRMFTWPDVYAVEVWRGVSKSGLLREKWPEHSHDDELVFSLEKP